jgi:hypothetical protein
MSCFFVFLFFSLAYAPVDPALKGETPDQAVLYELEILRAGMKAFLKHQNKALSTTGKHSLPYKQWFAQHSLRRFLEGAEIVRASRDAVAIKIDSSSDMKSAKLAFGFRGTAIGADVVVDVALALNKPHIERLEEARKFVRKVLASSRKANGAKWDNRDLMFS